MMGNLEGSVLLILTKTYQKSLMLHLLVVIQFQKKTTISLLYKFTIVIRKLLHLFLVLQKAKASMHYLFEVPVILPPHGNTKIDTPPYQCTQKSTLSKMKDTSSKPKSVVFYLCSEKGGITGATSCSELPRNRQQVYNSQCLSASNKTLILVEEQTRYSN